jgi:hypothetical protein
MVGREGMVEQSCSLHDSQESGREREREKERREQDICPLTRPHLLIAHSATNSSMD